MNFGSKVAVVLLLVAIVLCPSAACAMSAGQASQPSPPCCPPGKSHQSPVQQSDCKCLATLPSAPQFAPGSGSVPLADVPVNITSVQNVVRARHVLIFLPPVSDKGASLAVHQLRI
jgi:hypothetical protein